MNIIQRISKLVYRGGRIANRNERIVLIQRLPGRNTVHHDNNIETSHPEAREHNKFSELQVIYNKSGAKMIPL